jgi:cobalt ECF transporter T component CbiQ
MLIESLFNYEHKLAKTPILVKSIYVIPAFILSIISNVLVFHAVVFVLYFLGILIVTKIRLVKLLKLFFVPGIFILMGCVTLLFSLDIQNPLAKMIWIHKESYPMAISIFFKSYAIISVVYFWLLTNTISEITASMYACKIPPLFVELFVLTYKFIHLLMHTAKTMLIAQKCRLGYAAVRRNSINTFAYLFAAVLKKSMQQTAQLEIAMDSRLGNNKYVFVSINQPFIIGKIKQPIIFSSVLIMLFIICEI